MLFAETVDGNLGMPADPSLFLCNMEKTESSGRQCQDNIGQYAKEYIRVILLLAAVGLAVLLGFNTNTLSTYDSNNYIGLPVASVYSNTLDRVAPYSGTLLEAPEQFYIMNTDTLQSAIVYQVSSHACRH